MIPEREGPALPGVQLQEAPARLVFLVYSVLAGPLCFLRLIRASEKVSRNPLSSLVVALVQLN